MYTVSKRMEIAGAHYLNLSYPSPCEKVHGHNWIVTIEMKGRKLNDNGMIADFAQIKKSIHGRLDHQLLNGVIDVNPTAENIAFWIYQELTTEFCTGLNPCFVSKIIVQESEGNFAVYEPEGEF